MLLMLAAVPALFWDAAPGTAQALRDAGIQQIVVPAARLAAWKAVDGMQVEAADPQGAVKLQSPAVNYRINEATATRAPWVVANGWRIIRHPKARYSYEAPGKPAALAAAEAFCYGADALIHTDAAGLKPLGEMLAFLRTAGGEEMPPVADFGYLDDDSATSGEVMNLLVRDNLLFQLVKAPDRRFKINVKLGTPDYPLEDARNPGNIARAVRTHLTDEKRSIRIYGSQVVVARLTASGGHARVQLINYAGADRKVEGIRVRVLGQYPKHQLLMPGGRQVELMDFTAEAGATEFTLPELMTYAVIDLSR